MASAARTLLMRHLATIAGGKGPEVRSSSRIGAPVHQYLVNALAAMIDVTSGNFTLSGSW
jgi:hypothetical protein